MLERAHTPWTGHGVWIGIRQRLPIGGWIFAGRGNTLTIGTLDIVISVLCGSVAYFVRPHKQALALLAMLGGTNVGQACLVHPRRSHGGHPLPGQQPEPGGWNRLVVPVKNIAETVARLEAIGVTFRARPIKGPEDLTAPKMARAHELGIHENVVADVTERVALHSR